MEQGDAVRKEQHREHEGDAGEVAFHDVRTALRRRGEPHPAHARIAARVHEDGRSQADDYEYLNHCEKGEHALRVAADA